MPTRTLQVVILGDSASAQRAFEKTGAAAMAASKEAEKSATGFEKAGAKMSTLGTNVEKVGKKLTTHLTLPIVAVGGAAVKMSLDFQKAMLLVETHTETSHKQVEAYKKAILEMSASGKYTQGPTELAEAMYHIASDGYKGEKALQALRESANLAMLGQSELAETTYAVVSAMKTGIKGTQDLHETIGILNGTMGAGDTKMGELTAALSTGVVPAARAAGLELTDVGAALAFMTARGVPAQKAAYGLAMNFQQIVPYTKKAKDAFQSIGLGFEELGKKASSGPEGWLHALQDLHDHLQGLNKFGQTQVIEEIFGGGRTSRGVLAQLQNLKDLEATYERLGVISGRTDKNLRTARESEANVWKEEWAKLQSAMVEMGNALTPVVIPIFKEVASLVTGIAKGFNSMSDAEKGWVIKAGIAVAALGPMLTIGGNILKVFGAVEKTIGRIGRGLGVLEAEQAAGGATGGGVVPVGTGARGAAAAESAAPGWLGTGGETEESYLASQGITKGVSEGEAVRDALGIGAGGTVSAALKGVASKGFMALGGLVGGYFAAEFGAHAIEGITGADLLENQDLKTSLTHGFNTAGVAATEHRALTEAGHRERGINPAFAKDSRKELLSFERTFHNTLTTLEGEGAAGMATIEHTFHEGLNQADEIWIKGTKPWRIHTADAMEAAVAAIEEGMEDGTVKAKSGQKQIEKLLNDIHIVKGDDPFGLAKATADSFKKAGGYTATGVKKWAAQLAEMPPAARTSTIDATDKILQAWAQGHPKIEHSIKGLTNFEVTHFGATNKQLREGVKKGATGPVAEAFAEAAQGVGGALGNIGTNTNAMLKALGLHDMVQFQAIVFGPSRMGSTKTTAPGAPGEAKHHNRAGGGAVRVPGQGLYDTVPLSVNGKMSAVVAPGEDLVVFNRHQRPLIDQAVANEYGVAGLPGFFSTFGREHYKASGGSVHVSGPRSTGNIGQGVFSKATKAVNAYFKAHQPRQSSGVGGGEYTGKTPAGVGSFQGFPVDNWIIPELEYAVAHGWTGHITSGYRTPQHSAELGFPGDEHTKTAYPGGAVDFGGMHEAAAAANRAAFIAATAGYKGPRLRLPIGFVDDGHMSGTGHARGGPIGFAGGGIVGTVGLILERNGLDAVSAAAILGSAYGESSWNPASVGSGGGGLWGFTTPPISLADLQAYAAKQGKPWTSAEVQTQFLLHNFPSSMRATMNKMGSVADATTYFVENWERPETLASLPTRIAAGEKALKMLGGAGGSTGTAGKPSKKAVIEGGKYAKGQTHAGGTSAGFSTHKEIEKARAAGAAHATNPTISHGIGTSPLPSWARGLPLFQREELEGRGTTLPERETILGNAESNAAFGAGTAGRALEKARATYAKNPNAATWGAVAAAGSQAQVKRKAQVAATKARELFEKGYIGHLTKRIKKINAELANGAGKLTMKQVAALEAKRAELVSLRASARGESQSAMESLKGYEEAGEAEAAELEAESPLGMAAAGITEAFGEGWVSEMAAKGVENAEKAAAIPWEEAEAELALAGLTESTADDLAALEKEKAFANQKLAMAKGEGNLEGEIEWAGTLKGIEEAIKGLNESGGQSQLAEEMKSLREAIEQQNHFAESVSSTSAAVATRLLADMLSGYVGPRAQLQAQTAGNGSPGTF